MSYEPHYGFPAADHAESQGRYLEEIRPVIEQLREMGRKQEAANTATANPITLFQKRRIFTYTCPEGMEYCPDHEGFVFPEDFDPNVEFNWLGIPDRVKELYLAHEKAEDERGEQFRERFYLRDGDIERLQLTGPEDQPLTVEEWETVMVFGSVEEANAHGERCAHRYRAPDGSNGKQGKDWRAYTVCASGLLGEIIGWAIKEAIREAGA